MKEIDENNLETTIALGDAVCNELGICCRKRGQVIYQIYGKLEELKRKVDTPHQTRCANRPGRTECSVHRRKSVE
jgi:hypothetical protein